MTQPPDRVRNDDSHIVLPVGTQQVFAPSDPDPPGRMLIIVPAYNEQAALPDVLLAIRRSAPGHDIVVVDDGSEDATAEVARAAGITVLRLPVNLGVGGALRAGYRYARANGFSGTIQLDADGQHEPDDIRKLMAALNHDDIVVGTRFAGDGYEVGRLRRLAMTALAKTVSLLSGQRLTDVTSGFRAHGPSALALLADEMPAEYLGDTVESLVIAARSGLTIAEVPVRMYERRHGRPSTGLLRSAGHTLRTFAAALFASIRVVGDRGHPQEPG